MRSAPVLLGALSVALGAACLPAVDGAACWSDAQCPTGQVCSAACACAAEGPGVRSECPGFAPLRTLSGGTTGRFGSRVALSVDGQRLAVGDPGASAKDEPALWYAALGEGQACPVTSPCAYEGSVSALRDAVGVAATRGASAFLVGGPRGAQWLVPDWERSSTVVLGSTLRGPVRALAVSGGLDSDAWGATVVGEQVDVQRYGVSGGVRSLTTGACPEGAADVRLLLSPRGDLVVWSCGGQTLLGLNGGPCADGGACGARLEWWGASAGTAMALVGVAPTMVSRLADGGVGVYALEGLRSGVAEVAPRVLHIPGDILDLAADDSVRHLLVVRPPSDGGARVEAWEVTDAGAAWRGSFRPGEPEARASFGNAVAISADGRMVLIGAPGARRAYLYGR